MRALSSPGGQGHDRHINVTPLIDVVMVMIVFFLIVGKLAADERSDVDLPPARAQPRPADASEVIVNIPADRSLVLHGQTITPAALVDQLRTETAQRPDLVVQVRADRALSYGAIDPVLDACRQAGVRRVRLAAESLE